MPNFASLQSVNLNLSALGILLCCITLSGCIDLDDSPKIFEEVSFSSGLDNYKGMTHGAAWGDYDNDGFADLYLTNHLNSAQLFHNQGNGHFEEVSSQFFKPENLDGDKHGAIWADFNNDGLLDLVQLTGAGRGVGAESKRLFINHGNKFEDLASPLGVANEYGRTRMPLAMDVDHNGHLDLIQGAEVRFDKLRPPYMFFQQKNGSFIPSKDLIHFKGKSVPFCLITELNNDAVSELVCRVVGENRTAQIFDTSTNPATELELLPVTAFEDVAAGDFDNDGAIDLFLARKNPPGKVAFGRPESNSFIADINFKRPNLDKTRGFEFQTAGDVTFELTSAFPHHLLKPEMIHIGKNALKPKALIFTLSKETAGISSPHPLQAVTETGVYISFTAPDKWKILVSAATEIKKNQQFAFKITSTEIINGLAALNNEEQNEAASARLFMNRKGKLFEEGEKRGVNALPIAATNVVSGDFDNDMDLDLFMLASGDIGKQQNLLLINNGNGYFSITPKAAGAAGNKIGVGDSVTTVDYDNDGFLDLLTATGGSMGRSLGLPSANGSYKLYHNIGNKNHWLEINLQAASTNKNAIGAIVKITAGGVTQTRVQDNGVHNRSQNQPRLHFGLGKNTKIDSLIIQWPNGKTQKLENLKADQIIKLIEAF